MFKSVIYIFFIFLSFNKILFAHNIIANILDHKAEQKLDPNIEQNIRTNLSILHLPDDSHPTEEIIQELFFRSEQEIIESLQPYGYYSPTFKKSLQTYQNLYVANFKINLGPLTKISEINLTINGPGKYDFNYLKLLKTLDLTKNDVFLANKYERAKQNLVSYFVNNGYLNANFSQNEVIVDLESNNAEIYLTLETDQKFYFGRVDFNKIYLSENLLRNYIDFNQYDPYQAKKLLNLQSNFAKSGYFKDINITPKPDYDNYTVPVNVSLTLDKPNQYIIGAGFGTDTGVRGKLGYNRRYLNQLGHKFHIEGQLAEIYSNIEADYLIPGAKPQTDNYKLAVNYSDEEFNEQPSKILNLKFNATKKLTKWERIIGLSYKNEKYKPYTNDTRIKNHLLKPNLTLIRSIKDDPLNPTYGKRLEINLAGALEEALSDTSFLQAYLKFKWLSQLSENINALSKIELGATLPDKLEKLPLSERFYAGGDQSLRGFGYRSLPRAIVDDEYQPRGGTYLTIGSIELIYKKYDPLAFSIFADAGNAFRSNLNDKVQLGIGGGFSYRTPLGPVKIALAKPVTDAARSVRLHASFGPEI